MKINLTFKSVTRLLFLAFPLLLAQIANAEYLIAPLSAPTGLVFDSAPMKIKGTTNTLMRTHMPVGGVKYPGGTVYYIETNCTFKSDPSIGGTGKFYDLHTGTYFRVRYLPYEWVGSPVNEYQLTNVGYTDDFSPLIGQPEAIIDAALDARASDPTPVLGSTTVVAPPSLQKMVDTAQNKVATTAAAVAAATPGTAAATTAKADYDAAVAALNAATAQVSSALADSKVAAASSAAKTASGNLTTIGGTQAAGSTGEAVVAAGKATVSSIDAMKAEISTGIQKVADVLKSMATNQPLPGTSDNSGVESRIDTSNTHLSKIASAVDAGTAGSAESKAEAAGIVSSVKTGFNAAESTANNAAAGVTDSHGSALSRGASSSNGWGSPAAVPGQVPTAYVPMADLSFSFGSSSVTIPIDPVKVAENWGLLSFFAVARGLIVFGVLVGVYRWFVASIGPLISGLFSSESVHTTAVQTGTVGASFIGHLTGSTSFSLLKPVLSATRLALLLALPVAIVAILDTYLMSIGGSSSSGIFSGLNSAYSALLAAGGRGIYILNLVLPLPTLIFSGIYASSALSIVYGVFVVAKGKSAALQSV